MVKDLLNSRRKKTAAVKPVRAAKNADISTATSHDARPSKIEKGSKANPGDIDEIFSVMKGKKNNEVEGASASQANTKKHPKSERSSSAEQPKKAQLPHGVIKSDRNKIISPDPPVERIDSETGLKVYKAHLLKVGEGGGTPLCPFDCDCCF